MDKRSILGLLFESGLRLLYNHEKDALDQFLGLAENASSSRLKDIFYANRVQTQKQIERLEKIFVVLDIDVSSNKLQGFTKTENVRERKFLKNLLDMNFDSPGMDRCLLEGRVLLDHFGGTIVSDYVLVSTGRQFESLKLSSYRSLCLLARCLKNKPIINLLEKSLEEAEEIEDELSRFAENDLKMILEKAPIPVSFLKERIINNVDSPFGVAEQNR